MKYQLARVPIRIGTWSPSMRREWIEIGVERKQVSQQASLPPCGGSGLKCAWCRRNHVAKESPSMRREWIEMLVRSTQCQLLSSLPPCGGSGLKSAALDHAGVDNVSPSMRREWIEISAAWTTRRLAHVSLHAEGVD